MEEQKGPYYHRRKELMGTVYPTISEVDEEFMRRMADICYEVEEDDRGPPELSLPTISEVDAVMGHRLANMFYEELPPPLRPDLGLEPSLKGAGLELWNSPSDILMEKVILKPPFSFKCLKALTHEGILEMGWEIEQRFIKEMEDIKHRELADQEFALRAEFAKALRDLEMTIRLEEEEKFDAKLKVMEKQYQDYFEEQMIELEAQLIEEFNKVKEEEMALLEELWKEKLENAVEDVIMNLTKRFLEDLEMQKEELTETCNRRVRHQVLDSMVAMVEEQARCRESLKALQHNLECNNIANIMFVLCTERRKCQMEKREIQDEYEEKVFNLKKEIEEQKEEIKIFTEDRDDKVRKLNVREEFLRAILREFQKFINFVLRASPTQAEFLLDVEKMMMFQLTHLLTCKDPTPLKKAIAASIMEWRKNLSPMPSSTDFDAESLYHGCLKIFTPPPTTSELSEDALLPAIFYQDSMYVREDFRNMVSQGITISPSNMLWSKDVEDVQQIIKKNLMDASEKPLARSMSEFRQRKTSKISTSTQKHTITSGDASSKKGNISKDSLLSVVHFGKVPNKDDNFSMGGEKRATQPILVITDESEKLEHTNNKEQYATVDSLGLLCARDSLTKHRKSVASNAPHSSTRVPTSEIRFSLISHQEEIKRRVSQLNAVQSSSVVTEDSARELSNKSSVAFLNSQSSKIGMKNNHESHESRTKEIRKLREYTETINQHVSMKPMIEAVQEAEENVIESELEQTTEEKAALVCPQRAERCISIISMHQDSLEIIREHADEKHETQSDNIQDLGEGAKQRSFVKFDALPKVYETDLFNFSDSPWAVYTTESKSVAEQTEASSNRDNFLTKPNIAKIVGDRTAKEHTQQTDEFAIHRIESMVEILRNDSGLIKLFTGCST